MAVRLPEARSAAEAFRNQHITGKIFDKIPLDVLYVADVVLGLNLIGFPNLEIITRSAAYLTPGLVDMYLDASLFDSYDSPTAPIWKKERLRFSIAHEIGHIRMHPQLVAEIRCNNMDDLKPLFNTDDTRRYEIEQEANEFAGRLIVPIDKLEEAMKAFGSLQSDPRWRDSAAARNQFCEMVGPKFGLNSIGIGTRLNREDYLWPEEWTFGG